MPFLLFLIEQWHGQKRHVFLSMPERNLYMTKDIEQLNLIDNFLFTSVISDEEQAAVVSREILGSIFDRDFGKLKVRPQREILPPAMKLHGIRMDAYVEEEATSLTIGNIYDLEPDKKENEKQILPRRSRFYHSRTDSWILTSGESYKNLKNVYVIFILNFVLMDIMQKILFGF